jgi:uncharacterized membrane protein
MAKACTYRLVGSLLAFSVTFALTGRLMSGLRAAAAEIAIKIILYYWHERVWHHIHWGKVTVDPAVGC